MSACQLRAGWLKYGLAAQLLAGKLSKPAFDLIDPGCRCWREMHMIVWPPRQPCPDRCRFVGRVIVHDDVDIEILGDLSVDLFNEVQKFWRPDAACSICR